jgi:hypothetical protein
MELLQLFNGHDGILPLSNRPAKTLPETTPDGTIARLAPQIPPAPVVPDSPSSPLPRASGAAAVTLRNPPIALIWSNGSRA